MGKSMSFSNVQKSSWSLGAKLALVGTPFLIAALLSTVATLWVSWQLDGGAASVNEAGRMRMQAYRMALVLGSGEVKELQVLSDEYEKSFTMLTAAPRSHRRALYDPNKTIGG